MQTYRDTVVFSAAEMKKKKKEIDGQFFAAVRLTWRFALALDRRRCAVFRLREILYKVSVFFSVVASAVSTQ